MGKFIAFVVGGIVGAVVGAGVMLIAFPYLFPPPELNESVTSPGAEVVYSGSFIGSGDGVHEAQGGVKIYIEPVEMAKEHGGKASDNYHIELQKNFEALPGPNYWVYLNSVDVSDIDAFLADDKRKRLTKLKSFKGSQVYTVGAEDFTGTAQVSIWCESFDQFIAGAKLNDATPQ